MLSNKQIIEYIDVVKKSDLNGISELVHSWALDDDETRQITLKTKHLIKEIQLEYQMPLVMTVGGNYGVGKTTFCHEFGKLFDVPPRSGLGTVVKTLKYLNYDHPAVKMIDDDQSLDNFFEKFDTQAMFLCEIINFIAKKAQESGSDYIIDGVQINPAYINTKDVLLPITLAVPDYREHRERMTKPITHFRRTPRDFSTKYLHLVENYLITNAKNAGTPIIVNYRVNESVLIAGLMVLYKFSNLHTNNE